MLTRGLQASVDQNADSGWAFYGLAEVSRLQWELAGVGGRQGRWQVSGGCVGRRGSPASVDRFRGQRQP